MAKFIAVSGKGGVGKTTFTALLLRTLVKNKKASILAVDADPNANLNEALGLKVVSTISELMEETKDPKAIPMGMSKDVFVRYKLQQSLIEGEEIDLLVMGNPQGPGCYCYPNDLLRKYLESLSTGYDYVVVDTEAGLEHLSRRTIPKVDVLFVVSDASARGIRSAGRVHDIVRSLKSKINELHLIVTKTEDGGIVTLAEEIDRTGLNLAGEIPLDSAVVDYDLRGKALYKLPDDSIAVRAVESIAQKIKI